MAAGDPVTSPPRDRSPGALPSGRTPPLVVAGRVALAVFVLAAVVGTAFGPVVHGAERAAGPLDLPPSGPLTLLMAVIWLCMPLLLLPVGSDAHARVDDGTLTLVTVLGERRVDLDRVDRIGAVSIMLRFSRWYFLVLRRGLRWYLVSLENGPGVPWPVRERLLLAAAERPGIVSSRARAMLSVGERPGLVHRAVLGAVTFVVGTVVVVGWMSLGVVAGLLVMPAGW